MACIKFDRSFQTAQNSKNVVLRRKTNILIGLHREYKLVLAPRIELKGIWLYLCENSEKKRFVEISK